MENLLVQEIKNEVELRLLKENIPRIVQCLQSLHEDSIWRKTNENSNTIGNLILHLCGNVRQYLISSIGGKPDLRKRNLEFSTDSKVVRATLIQQLELLSLEIKEAIPKITQVELLRSRSVQGFTMTGISVVIHVIEHFSYHTGQIAFYTKQLQNIDLKFYGDLDLTVTSD